MKRYTHRLAMTLVATAMLTLPATADRIPLDELSRYLNGLETAQTDFTQVNADGSVSTGTLYIHRPGRVRFEYDPPDAGLVLAAGGTVAIFDPKSNQGPSQYPLRQTPLNLILARDVDLTRERMVIAHESDDTSTSVVAQDPENPDQGNIRLVFTDNPTELRQWVITDDTGQQTTVILQELNTDVSLGHSLFSIQQNMRNR